MSGIILDASKGYMSTSPALDRIDPSLGYVPGNIRLISGMINSAKGDMPDDLFNQSFLSVCKFYLANNE